MHDQAAVEAYEDLATSILRSCITILRTAREAVGHPLNLSHVADGVSREFLLRNKPRPRCIAVYFASRAGVHFGAGVIVLESVVSLSSHPEDSLSMVLLPPEEPLG